ncbi:MAG: flagellar basal body rod protein FlgB [Alphaproteobacteria bacterium]|jgi:flagellar basal-body rod protein FlgB|nr:hypothetical protein [Candidatus Jidaibacter sp.]
MNKAIKLIAFLILCLTPSLSIAYDAFEELYDHMGYLTERDKILSQNIANADTPKYRPQDIKKRRGGVDDVHLHMTNSMHMDLNSTTDYTLFSPKLDEIKPNGNGVNIERELFKKNENSQKLTEATNIYNKSKSILNTAIQGLNR